MSESNFSFTTKINGDLFTIRGNTAEELTQNFADAVSENVIDYITSFQKLAQEPTTQTTTTVKQPTPQAEPEKVQATFPTPMQCKHGPMNFKEGIAGPKAKNPGMPYKMWVCPSGNRNDECKPIWAGN